jgi:hypothetical protein
VNNDLYECRPSPADLERHRIARELAQEYEETCDLFDRTVCIARNERGVAIPTRPGELGKISAHAIEVKKLITRKASEYGLTWQDIKDAMNG